MSGMAPPKSIGCGRDATLVRARPSCCKLSSMPLFFRRDPRVAPAPSLGRLVSGLVEVPAGAHRPAACVFRVRRVTGADSGFTNRLAHRVEHLAFNQRVVGSNPTSQSMFARTEQSFHLSASRPLPRRPRLNIEAPAKMAAGLATVAALCAGADTAFGTRARGLAPARSDPRIRRGRSQARTAKCPRLKRWSVASTREAVGDLTRVFFPAGGGGQGGGYSRPYRSWLPPPLTPPHEGRGISRRRVVLFKFKVIVKDDERAFLTRDGRFERLLGPGRFMALDYGRRRQPRS